MSSVVSLRRSRVTHELASHGRATGPFIRLLAILAPLRAVQRVLDIQLLFPQLRRARTSRIRLRLFCTFRQLTSRASRFITRRPADGGRSRTKRLMAAIYVQRSCVRSLHVASSCSSGDQEQLHDLRLCSVHGGSPGPSAIDLLLKVTVSRVAHRALWVSGTDVGESF